MRAESLNSLSLAHKAVPTSAGNSPAPATATHSPRHDYSSSSPSLHVRPGSTLLPAQRERHEKHWQRVPYGARQSASDTAHPLALRENAPANDGAHHLLGAAVHSQLRREIAGPMPTPTR